MSKHTPSPWSVKSADWDSEGDVRYTLNGIKHFSAPDKNLIEAAPDLLKALIAANEFIDGIRQDLHHNRVADWYPEGAHNSAAAMSESMRLIGNRCADFDAASSAIAKATRETP